MKASEFGGSDGKHGIQPEKPDAVTKEGVPAPSGHLPTASEKLRLIYTTGTEDQQADVDLAIMDGWAHDEGDEDG